VDACQDLKNKAETIRALSAQIAGLNTGTCAVAPTNYTPGSAESLFPPNTGSVPVDFNLASVARQDNGIAKLNYHVNDKQMINTR